jgi:hypothetical protein
MCEVQFMAGKITGSTQAVFYRRLSVKKGAQPRLGSVGDKVDGNNDGRIERRQPLGRGVIRDERTHNQCRDETFIQ